MVNSCPSLSSLLGLLSILSLLFVSTESQIIIPISQHGAVVNDSSPASVAANDLAFTSILTSTRADTANSHIILLDLVGTYYIGILIEMSLQNNLTVEGNGQTMVSTILSSMFSFGYYGPSSNIRIQNLTLDWKPAPSVGGIVLALDPSNTWFDIAVSAAYVPADTVRANLSSSGVLNYVDNHFGDVMTFWAGTGTNIAYAPVAYPGYPSSDVLRIPVASGITAAQLPTVQDTVVVTLFVSRIGIFMGKVTNMYLTNLVVYNVPGMGFQAANSTNVYFNNIQLLKKPGQYMSSVSDASHFAGCHGEIVIEDCLFEGSNDDGTNIQTKNMRILAVDTSSNTIQTSTYTRSSSNPVLPDHVNPGDLLEIGAYATPFNPFATVVAASYTQGPTYFNITLTGPIPAGVVVGDIAVPATLPSAVFRNFTVRNNRAHGILLKNRNVLVDGCTFINNSSPGIEFYTEDNSYWEGSTTRNITIQNTFIYNDAYPGRFSVDIGVPADVSPGQPAGAHRNIIFRGNYVMSSPQPAKSAGVYLAQATNVLLENNFITSPLNYALVYCNSQGVNLTNNILVWGKSEPTSNAIGTSGCFENGTSLNINANLPCDGVYAQFYDNPGLTGDPLFTERNPVLNFTALVPGGSLQPDQPWSVRWGTVLVTGSENVTGVSVYASDSIQVYLDSVQIITTPPQTQSVARELQGILVPMMPANTPHVLRIIYSHTSTEPAELILSWTLEGGETDVIPTTALTTPFCNLPLVPLVSSATSSASRSVSLSMFAFCNCVLGLALGSLGIKCR